MDGGVHGKHVRVVGDRLRVPLHRGSRLFGQGGQIVLPLVNLFVHRIFTGIR